VRARAHQGDLEDYLNHIEDGLYTTRLYDQLENLKLGSIISIGLSAIFAILFGSGQIKSKPLKRISKPNMTY
jgi:hypothetical protein